MMPREMSSRMNSSTFNIEEELKKLPGRPGVYLMHDETDQIIYVGKALSLKNRVRQYFQSSRNRGAKIDQMVTHIRRFEYIVTDSESEALVLECNLIKEYHPHYNTMLMDDKSYPFIRVTVSEPYPRIQLVRRIEGDRNRNRYFGPYPNVGAIRVSIELLRKLYKIRSCNRRLPEDTEKNRPCLHYYIGQCDAPCQGLISQEEYDVHIKKALDFLSGHYKPVENSLKEKMEAASEAMEYERAQEYRDLLMSVQTIAQKQKITSSSGGDRDVLALAMEKDDAVAVVFFIRNGRILGRDHCYLSIAEGDTEKTVLESFVKQYYAGTPYIPHELMLPTRIDDADTIEEWLSKRLGAKVRILVPQKGTKEKLVELAQENAAMVLKQDSERLRREQMQTTGAVAEIAELLGISSKITRIEAYDISNTAGFESVGSMVVYENGRPKKNDYRKFKIRTIEGSDDYGSMREVLSRRFQHGLAEQKRQNGKSFSRFPDLIMMDGGKGQVHVAEEVLSSFGLRIPVCGMVKDDHHRTRGLYFHDTELPIDRGGEGFKLITRIQDEAHRFAITYHRKRRSQAQVHSILDDIPGIGSVRRKALRRAYESLEDIRNADISELAMLPGMNRAAAESVYRFFHAKEDEISNGGEISGTAEK